MSNNENWGERPAPGPRAGVPRQGLGETWAARAGVSHNGGGQAAPGQNPPAAGRNPVPYHDAQQGGPAVGGSPSDFGQSAPAGYGRGGYAPQAQQPHRASLGQAYPSSPGQQWSRQPSAAAGTPTNAGRHAQSDTFGAHTAFAEPKAKAGLGRLMGWAVVASALLAVIGCFGTWMYVKLGGTFGDLHASANGLGTTSSNVREGSSGADRFRDGWFVLIPAIVAVVLGVLRGLGRLPKPAMWGALVMGLVVTGVSVFEWSDIRSKVNDLRKSMDAMGETTFSAGSGWGLGLCIFAGVALLVTSALSALRD